MTMFLAALIFGCAVAFAADSNSPAHRDRGPGPGPRPGPRQPAGGFMQELSEKLNLTEAQKTAIKPIMAAEANEIKAVHQDGSLSNEQKAAKTKEIRTNSREKINAILTPEQQKKFAEMNAGPARGMPGAPPNRLDMLAAELSLTDVQKAAIGPIMAAEANEIKAVHQDGSLSNEQKATKIQEIRKNSMEKTNTILTPEQQKKFTEMNTAPAGRMAGEPQRRLDMLAEQLNLTDAQKAAIKPILAAEANDIKAVEQDNALSMEQKQSKISGIREASSKKIDATLTPEQQAKSAKLKENAKQQRNKKPAPGE
jgi:Spy/CpxP family protein refolding chaperone